MQHDSELSKVLGIYEVFKKKKKKKGAKEYIRKYYCHKSPDSDCATDFNPPESLRQRW